MERGGGSVGTEESEEMGQTTALTRTLACWSSRIPGTASAVDKDGNDTRERRRPCAESRCAQVCALALLRDDQPGSVTCQRVAAENRSRQILW
jgi:hypothetical protein